ncbi:MAG TPA: hypothetical protein VHX49_09260 [Candidatus Acidoferrales bacterium]|jgi:hypothetical protein|nr:hypothetical protein [Candidatus Acidoferrales bacterium]
MGDTRSALEYLVACSEMSIESFQISRMNQAANLRGQVRVLVDQWIEAEVDAGISRWMLVCRRGRKASALRMDHLFGDKFLDRVAIALLPGRVEVSAVAQLQARLSFATAEAGPVREPPSLEAAAGTADDRKHLPEERPPRGEKPYAKPVAQKHVAAFRLAHYVLPMPGCSRSRAQRELPFESGESILDS